MDAHRIKGYVIFSGTSGAKKIYCIVSISRRSRYSSHSEDVSCRTIGTLLKENNIEFSLDGSTRFSINVYRYAHRWWDGVRAAGLSEGGLSVEGLGFVVDGYLGVVGDGRFIAVGGLIWWHAIQVYGLVVRRSPQFG